jgi:hypothetical protein
MEVKGTREVAIQFSERPDLLTLDEPAQRMALMGMFCMAGIEMPITLVKLFVREVVPEILRQREAVARAA